MTESKPVNNSSKTAVFFALLIGFIALFLVAGSAGYFQMRFLEQLRKNAALNLEVDRLAEQIQQQAKSQQNLTQQVQDQFSDARSLRDEFTLINNQFQQLPGARRDDWRLAEVEYLLRLASQRLQLQQDSKGALLMLNDANNILAEVDDPGLLNVRKQLSVEIRAVSEQGNLDYQGIFLRIEALKEPLAKVLVPAQNFVSPVAENEQKPDIWQRLLNLVSVRRLDKPLQLALSEGEGIALQHNLRLMLEQAQWALLRREPQVYQSSLKNAHDWLSRFAFQKQADALLEELNSLQSLNITSEVPDISSSLNLLRDVQLRRAYQPGNKP